MPVAPPDLLYVITDLRLGGVPLHLRRLVQAVRGEGLHGVVASLAPGGEVAAMLRAEGVTVVDCGGRGGWDARVIWRLGTLIAKYQPRLIHSFLFHANIAARIAARLHRYPAERLICEIQTVEVERHWHLAIDHWTHEWCRFTIGNSPSVVDHLARVGGIPRSRLRMVRGGVDAPAIRQASPADRGALGIPAEVPVVLWVGRLDPVKGLHVLCDAFSIVAQECDAHLLLAGDGPLRDELRSRIDDLNLSDRVHLLGPRTDVPSLLRIADVFVLPSRTEGLPNALLEALAAGVPAIASDVPGCRDLVRHGETGLLVPYGDVPALAAGIRRLLRDRVSAMNMAPIGQRSVEQHWSLDETRRNYLDLYRDIPPCGLLAPG